MVDCGKSYSIVHLTGETTAAKDMRSLHQELAQLEPIVQAKTALSEASTEVQTKAMIQSHQWAMIQQAELRCC
jgi:hypothetical protein